MKKADVELAIAQAVHANTEGIRKRAQAMTDRNITSRDDEYGRGWNDALRYVRLTFGKRQRKPQTVGEAWVRHAQRGER